MIESRIEITRGWEEVIWGVIIYWYRVSVWYDIKVLETVGGEVAQQYLKWFKGKFYVMCSF